MLGNLVTNSQDLLGWKERMRETGYPGGPGNERRWLYLHYSIDALNWFPAGCVARWQDSVAAASCIQAPSSTGMTWWYYRVRAGIPAISTMLTCAPSTA